MPPLFYFFLSEYEYYLNPDSYVFFYLVFSFVRMYFLIFGLGFVRTHFFNISYEFLFGRYVRIFI